VRRGLALAAQTLEAFADTAVLEREIELASLLAKLGLESPPMLRSINMPAASRAMIRTGIGELPAYA
jgi:hypothetical protein